MLFTPKTTHSWIWSGTTSSTSTPCCHSVYALPPKCLTLSRRPRMAPNMREDGVRNILRMILWCLVLSREKWSGRTTFRCLKRSDPGPLLVVPPEKWLYIDAEKQLGADKQLREDKQLGADKQQGVDLHSNNYKHLSLSLAKRLPVVRNSDWKPCSSVEINCWSIR